MEYTNIYSLSDPNTGEIRYIGKTYNKLRKRLYAHINECKSDNKSHKISWIKGLLSNGEIPVISIIDIVPTDDWQFWEQYWIEQFKQWGFNLTNIAKGGYDNSYNRSDKTKKKMRDSKLGKPLSEEQKEKISKSVKEDWKNNPREVEKYIIITKEELFQRYIIENLSMPKLSKLFGCSKATIFRNLHEHGIKKGKEVWIKQLSTNPKKVVLQYDLKGNLIKEWSSLSEIDLGILNISNCCLGRAITAGGYIWRYKDEFIEINLEKLNYQKRKVSQYDMLGNHIMTFESMSTAALLGFNDSNIQDCCVGRSKSHRGFIWRYAEDTPPEKYKKKQQRSVNQFDMNGEFIRSWESIVSATKELSIGGNSITTCCKGGYKSAGGFVWKYNQ